jgi:Transposase DDE domain
VTSHTHHTTPATWSSAQTSAQTRPDAWSSEILPRLPADLEQQAKELGAFTRRRGFDSAADLLRGLLYYAGEECSLRQLGIWGVLQEVADLAASSWQARLRNASAWLQWLVTRLVQTERPRWLSHAVRGRVLLIDATSLRQIGGTGDDYRLHLAYNLSAARIEQLVLTDGHTAEHVQHFGFQAGDLAIFDGGYGYRDRVTTLRQQHVDCVLRIYPPTFPLLDAGGRAFDMRAWLDRPGSGQREVLLYYHDTGQHYPIRVLALRRNECQRHSARQRARERARKRNRPLSRLAEYYADWIIVVTTLLEQEWWPFSSIWRLYGARWQVELLFKRLKQFLGLGSLRCWRAASVVPLIWALLLLWVLHEGVAQQVQRALMELAEPAPATLPGAWPVAEAVVSGWGVSELLLRTLRQAIAGQWTLALVLAKLPRLRRYLQSHPRGDREHQASEVIAWLSGIRRTRRRPLPDAE